MLFLLLLSSSSSSSSLLLLRRPTLVGKALSYTHELSFFSFYRAVRPSVCPSVKRVDCDKTEEWSAQISIPYEGSFSLIFWGKEWLVGGDPYLKFCRMDRPFPFPQDSHEKTGIGSSGYRLVYFANGNGNVNENCCTRMGREGGR